MASEVKTEIAGEIGEGPSLLDAILLLPPTASVSKCDTEETKDHPRKNAIMTFPPNISDPCNGGARLVAESGSLQSPNYPEDYPRDAVCSWQIEVPEGFQVVIQFQDIQLERSGNCIDYIEIRDGPNEQSTPIGTYCGEEKPKDIASTSNHLYIRFRSDGSDQYRGFNITFTKGECKWMKCCFYQEAQNGGRANCMGSE